MSRAKTSCPARPIFRVLPNLVSAMTKSQRHRSLWPNWSGTVSASLSCLVQSICEWRESQQSQPPSASSIIERSNRWPKSKRAKGTCRGFSRRSELPEMVPCSINKSCPSTRLKSSIRRRFRMPSVSLNCRRTGEMFGTHVKRYSGDASVRPIVGFLGGETDSRVFRLFESVHQR